MFLDSVGMFDAAAALPEQLALASDSTRATLDDAVLPAHDSFSNIVLVGVGADGQAASLVLEAAGPTLSVPVVVDRGYAMPNFVDEATLVIGISFDGETTETVDAIAEAADDGAQIVTVSNGGALRDLAQDAGALHLPVVPTAPVARAALGAMAVPVLLLLEEIGHFPGATAWIDEAISQTARRRDRLISEDNLASRLARRIGRSLPIVYGGNGPGGMAAAYWKTQFNENAKIASFANQVPELTHNEIAGWGLDGDVTRQVFQSILLRHDFEHPSVSARMELVEELMVEVVGAVHVVEAEGEGLLAQLLDLLLVGQFVSLRVAAEQGVDPGPTPIVDELAGRIGDH